MSEENKKSPSESRLPEESNKTPPAPSSTSAPSSTTTPTTVNTSKKQEQRKQDGEEEEDTPDPSILRRKLQEDIESKIEVQQNDPTSPLYSAKTFEELGLKPSLLRGIYDLKFHKPSRIQEVSLPMILGTPPKNLIAQAQSGTGKTACFSLGMLSKVDESRNETQALCICPTRELARQIYAVVGEMGKYSGVKTLVASSHFKATGVITEHIVIGTPGKLLDLIEKRYLKTNGIKIFVLDEADVMLDQQGLADQSVRIKKYLPRNCQILLFSATFKERVKDFALRVVPSPNIIHVKREQLPLDIVRQFYIKVANVDEKYRIISDIYGSYEIGQSIIFCETRATAKDLAIKMKNAGYSVSLLHGADMEATLRDKIIDEFRKGTTRVLITTNVLSRGIDIPQVNLVVNYDLPVEVKGNELRADAETYYHRIGRTGRFGRPGVAVSLVDPDSMVILKYIEAFFKKPITELPSNNFDQLETLLLGK